jgi:hypothetical protein
MWTEILERDNSIHTVFTDDAKVHVSRHVCQHNCVLWSSMPPRKH